MKNLNKEVERLEAVKEKLEDKITQMEAERDSLAIDELDEKAYRKKWDKMDETIENLYGEVETLQEAIDLLEEYCW